MVRGRQDHQGREHQGRGDVSFGTIAPILYRPVSAPEPQIQDEKSIVIEKRSDISPSSPLPDDDYGIMRPMPVNPASQPESSGDDSKFRKRDDLEQVEGYVPGGSGSGGQYDKGQPYGR
ncbi:hypothetical protein BGX31_001117 [Mortierella sp. GBA43]|nr:hypothetical protein BGX31_001117 [Mortierella sp. GBA43]